MENISWGKYRNAFSRDVFSMEDGKEVRLIGWIAFKREHKDKVFLQLRDRYGYIQLVVSQGSSTSLFEKTKNLNIESAVAVRGVVKSDVRAPGGKEVHVNEIHVVADADVWPITKEVLNAPDTMYDLRHLTMRGPRSRSILLVREGIILGSIEYFTKNGYVFITAPTFITAAVEGGATLFKLKYFDRYAYLTQSSQFYEEAAICVFEKVFVVQPSFRAEKSRTRKHLTEFLHIEAEAAFLTHDDIMDVEEELLKHIISYLNRNYEKEIKFLLNGSLLKEYEDPFPRIKYEEAISILQSKGVNIEWGEDFGSDEERILSKEFDTPFFVTHFPVNTRSFYHMNDPNNEKVTLSSDLMAPDGYGEITSGGQRIHKYEDLLRKIKEFGLNPEDYQWYLDIRKYGMPPHSGFGMGVERVARWLLKLPHVRDATLFPRTPSRIYP